MKNNITWLAAALLLTLTGCRINTLRVDNKNDQMDAEQASGQFYALIKLSGYGDTYGLLSSKFLETTDSARFVAYLQQLDATLGTVENTHMDICKTRIVEGTNSETDYMVQYTVKRTKNVSKEFFGLTKEKGKIKIYAYKVESDGFK